MNTELKKSIEEKYEPIDTNITRRWENGRPHHKKSEALMFKIKELDFHFNSDQFCWKTGGDGDNGESLMYLLDVIFEKDDWETGKRGRNG